MTTEIRTSTGGSSSRRRISPATPPDDQRRWRSRRRRRPRTSASASERTNVPLTTASDGRAVGDQGRRVVEQRLALDQGPDHPRRAEPAEHRRGGERIGRRHDRPEREGRRPADAGDRGLGHGRDDHHRERARGRTTGAASGARFVRRSRIGRLDRGGEQQRRQEHEQDQVRLELDVGQAGHERQAEPAEHEQGRDRARRCGGRSRTGSRSRRGRRGPPTGLP